MSEFLAITLLLLCFRVRLNIIPEMVSGSFYDPSGIFWWFAGFMLKLMRSVFIGLY
jgi:hypothetical protein